MKILATIMVYNEIDFIEMYLRNIEHLVDGVLIMDGGSTDGTVKKICEMISDEEYSLSIFYHRDEQKGENYNDPEYNHQKRRNILINHAERICLDCDYHYIFQMDVDESIIEKDKDVLRNLIKSHKNYYTFPRYDFCWHPRYYRKRCYGRYPWLYKANIGIRYGSENAPHEQLEINGNHLATSPNGFETDIMIFHWHYCFGRKAMRDYGVKPWEKFLKARAEAIKNDKELVPWTKEMPEAYFKYCEDV